MTEKLDEGAGKINYFFRLDYRTGAVTSKITQERVQVVPALGWRKLKDALTRHFDYRASLMMSLIGASVGSSFAEEIMTDTADPEALAKHMSDVATAAGWGVFSMIGDMRYGSKCVVTVANCVFCDESQLGCSTTPQCDFLVGLVKAMLDRVYGTPHRIREEKCTAMGDPVCQLAVQECDGKEVCPECNNPLFCEWPLHPVRRARSDGKTEEIPSEGGEVVLDRLAR
jgi:predicted hydrocarbon binding protein